MPTLYVENIPEELYSALKARAKEHRKSLAAEVISILSDQVPTAEELARRLKFFEAACRLRSELPSQPGPFPSTEEMIREDRRR